MAYPLIENAHGADPGAEESTEYESSDDNNNRQCEAFVHRPACKKSWNGNQRIEFEKQRYLISFHVAEICYYQKKNKENKKEYGICPSYIAKCE
jgi:hypothetical protein